MFDEICCSWFEGLGWVWVWGCLWGRAFAMLLFCDVIMLSRFCVDRLLIGCWCEVCFCTGFVGVFRFRWLDVVCCLWWLPVSSL